VSVWVCRCGCWLWLCCSACDVLCVCFCVFVWYLTVTAATAGETATFLIQSRDEIGNNVNWSPNLMVFLLKSNNELKAGPSVCQVTPDTVIISSLKQMSNTSATVSYIRSLSGPVAFQVALLQPGGLSMSIYDGVVSNEINELSTIEETSTFLFSALDMNFGGGRIAVDLKQVYFSSTTLFSWKGYLVPRFTEFYTFHVSGNGCTNFNISGNMMFTCSNGTTGSLKLRANELHTVDITYRNSHGEPSLVLFWQSTSQQREVIPSSCW
jgi:hypothetical protein